MSDAVQMIEVVAPSDLTEGYLLDVELDGVVRTIVVPEGGVAMGETFAGIVLPQRDQRPPEGPAPKLKTSHIPSGAWRDGCCDCCTNTPVCCMSCWCGPVVLGQVMTRLRLNWCGFGAGKPPSESRTCIIVTAIFLAYMVVFAVIYSIIVARVVECNSECDELISYLYHDGHWLSDKYYHGFWSFERCYGWDQSQYVYYYHDVWTTERIDHMWDAYMECLGTGRFVALCVLWGLTLVIVLYIPITMCQTRQKLREKYGIRGSCCDDCCCSYCCPCCTVSQMARHTNDYEAYPVECCSGDCFNKTGQDPKAHAIEH
ncbi:PLAC8 family [Fragilaria crotonensis]|nr:PLAC8 family [Fragilaria crotonensis]